MQSIRIAAENRLVGLQQRRQRLLPQLGGLLPHLLLRPDKQAPPVLLVAAAQLPCQLLVVQIVGQHADQLCTGVFLPLLHGQQHARLDIDELGRHHQKFAHAVRVNGTLLVEGRQILLEQQRNGDVPDVELVLLDEPFSALDAYLKWQVELELSDILKNLSCGTLFVTHNRDEVYRLCDTVSCMNRGKMEVMEPLKEFFQNPKTRTAAILSGCKNISAAERVDAHTLRAVDWGVTLHVKEREIADDIRAVGIRAHFLATVERPGEENVFPVNESEIWEDPFEWNISFRKNAECSWLQWKIAKTDWSPEMGIPKELYLKEEDILLLTDS